LLEAALHLSTWCFETPLAPHTISIDEISVVIAASGTRAATQLEIHLTSSDYTQQLPQQRLLMLMRASQPDKQ